MDSRLQIRRMLSELEQHGWIIDRLWALSLTPESALETRRWRRLLQAEMRHLVAILTERFEAEEADGYMAHVARAVPELDAQLETLHQQHSTILSGLHDVGAALRAGHEISACQARIREVLTVLHAHEHGERELAQDLLVRRESGQEPVEAA